MSPYRIALPIAETAAPRSLTRRAKIWYKEREDALLRHWLRDNSVKSYAEMYAVAIAWLAVLPGPLFVVMVVTIDTVRRAVSPAALSVYMFAGAAAFAMMAILPVPIIGNMILGAYHLRRERRGLVVGAPSAE